MTTQGTRKFDWKTVLFVENVVCALVLTGMAIYNPENVANEKGLLSYPEWAAPLVFLVGTLIFAQSAFFSWKRTLIGVGLMFLTGVFLLFPIPGPAATTLKWWYPLGVALAINVFARDL